MNYYHIQSLTGQYLLRIVRSPKTGTPNYISWGIKATSKRFRSLESAKRYCAENSLYAVRIVDTDGNVADFIPDPYREKGHKKK